MQYYIGVLKKYAVFSGRAGRAEYWYFALFNFIIYIVLGIVDRLISGPIEPGQMAVSVLTTLYSLAVLIPSLAVSARRLHDTNRSGWWLLLGFVPLVGPIVLLVFMVMGSDSGANQYGPNPSVQGGDQPPMPTPEEGGQPPVA
ncbi:MAG: DUF805 domain-containing protein [Patescibacteria group bacterium]|nr:DUF805 domain-containing protein [Patescibacteria group bacterium]